MPYEETLPRSHISKWCCRLPRITSPAFRICDYYVEIIFHSESSVIPFIGRIAAKSRVDMTLADFMGLGFKVEVYDLTKPSLVLGDGFWIKDGKVLIPPGSLSVLSHKEN
ncbi:hypothetical protein LXL04_008603 [Taraxacum kok-saghyz]